MAIFKILFICDMASAVDWLFKATASPSNMTIFSRRMMMMSSVGVLPHLVAVIPAAARRHCSNNDLELRRKRTSVRYQTSNFQIQLPTYKFPFDFNVIAQSMH